jgi:hypothetical protein
LWAVEPEDVPYHPDNTPRPARKRRRRDTRSSRNDA